MFTNRSRLPSFLIEIIILEVTILLFPVVLGGYSFPMEFLRGTFLSGFPFGRGYGGEAILGTEVSYFVLGFALTSLALDLHISAHFHSFTTDCARDISIS